MGTNVHKHIPVRRNVEIVLHKTAINPQIHKNGNHPINALWMLDPRAIPEYRDLARRAAS
jgi:hypothetical protein